MSAREYDVFYEGWGHGSSTTVTARSRSAAKYSAWHDISEPTGITFEEFITGWVVSVKVSRTGPRQYDYILQRYGLRFRSGDKVVVGKNQPGRVAAPPNNGRSNYVWITSEMHKHPQPYHPTEVVPE